MNYISTCLLEFTVKTFSLNYKFFNICYINSMLVGWEYNSWLDPMQDVLNCTHTTNNNKN